MPVKLFDADEDGPYFDPSDAKPGKWRAIVVLDSGKSVYRNVNVRAEDIDVDDFRTSVRYNDVKAGEMIILLIDGDGLPEAEELIETCEQPDDPYFVDNVNERSTLFFNFKGRRLQVLQEEPGMQIVVKWSGDLNSDGICDTFIEIDNYQIANQINDDETEEGFMPYESRSWVLLSCYSETIGQMSWREFMVKYRISD